MNKNQLHSVFKNYIDNFEMLNNPDHHYMYKATQSKVMADCIEFYDDWGSGDNIKLDIYYRMCKEIVDEIKSSP